MARRAARERRRELRRKMPLGNWMISELQQSAEEPDVQVLRHLLRCQLPKMTLRDADRELLEELLNGVNRGERSAEYNV